MLFAVPSRLLFRLPSQARWVRLPEPRLKQADVDAHQAKQAHDARGDSVGGTRKPDDRRVAGQPKQRLVRVRCVTLLVNMVKDVKENQLRGIGSPLGGGVQQSLRLLCPVPITYLLHEDLLNRDHWRFRHEGMLPRYPLANCGHHILNKNTDESTIPARQPVLLPTKSFKIVD